MNVLITHISGYLGQALVARLEHRNPFNRVFGVDSRPPSHLGPVQFIRADPRTVDLGDLLVLNDVSIVVHLADRTGQAAQRVGDLDGELEIMRSIVEAASLTEIRRLVVMSSHAVYGSWLGPPFSTSILRRSVGTESSGSDPADRVDRPRLEGDALLAAETRLFPHAHLLAHIERMLEQLAPEHPQLEIATIRSGHILGPDSGSPLSDLLALPALLGVAGIDPVVECLHLEDAADLLVWAAAEPVLRGPMNAAGGDPPPLSVVAGILQKPLIRVPQLIARPAASLLGRIGRKRAGCGDVAALHCALPINTGRLVGELGWQPRYTTRQTIAGWRAARLGHGGK